VIEAAFGDRPDLVITSVPHDPESRWLAAVALGGQGRYARAAALLNCLLPAFPASRVDIYDKCEQRVASLAASTLASHRRQLGGHAAAWVLDAVALAAAPPEAAEARSDALLGLAADALGLGRIGVARRLIAAARQLGDAGWRAEIRIGWVSAEVELGAGNPELAVPHAEQAAELAGASGSTRHRIKSALVLGAALAGSAPDRAREMLGAVRAEASGRGLLPLVWPCALLLADVEPQSARAHRRCAGHALHSVLRRADPIGRRIAERSPWVPDPAGLTG
jgi:hypothetical protein